MDEKRKKEIEEIAHREATQGIFSSPTTEKSNEDEKEYREAMRENAPYLTLGFQLAITIALGAFIGNYIDSKNGTNLWLGLGAGIGAFLGLGYFVSVVLRMSRKDEKKRKK